MGTSKKMSKYGPADLPTITKILQQIQEQYGNILKTYYFHLGESGNSIVSNFVERYRHHVVSYCFVFFWTNEYICLYDFVERRIGKWWIFPKKHFKRLGHEFHIYQKTCNGKVVSFLFSGKGIPKLFYFRGRESSNMN